MGARDGKPNMRGWGRLLAAVALLCSLLTILPAPSQAATLHQAGLIVRHGNGGETFVIVAFAENEISAIDLLERAKLDAVTVEFGGLGSAVCMIEREGCPPSVCEKKVCQSGAAESPFWHFYQLGATGDWQFAALGPSSVHVKSGDVVGWSWTGKDAGLPVTTFAKLLAESAQHGQPGVSDAAASWHVGPLPASNSSSRQSWFVYAGAGVIFIGVLGALVFALARWRTTRVSLDGFD